MGLLASLALALAAQSAPTIVTECDTLAAHPSDPDRVTAGVPDRLVNAAAAIAACKTAVAADPSNGRLNYQLARSLAYDGRGVEAAPYREAAVKADYPQALFVAGHIHLFGLNDAAVDACKAADLIRRSALKGQQAGLVGFPHWSMQGRFKGCPVKQDKAEMLSFLVRAKAQVYGDFYQILLVETLEHRLVSAD